MKSLKPLLAVVGVMLLAALTGCQQKIEDPYISVVGETTINLNKDKTTLTVQITTNREWGVRLVGTTTDWIVAEPARGSASDKPIDVKVTITENTGSNRTAAIEFYTGVATAMVTINQEGPNGTSDGVLSVTVQNFINRADKETYFRMTGKVSGFRADYCSFDLTDETGTIYVYSVTESSKAAWAGVIKNGGTVTIQGKYDFYASKSQHEVVDAIIESFTPVEVQTDITDATVADFISTASSTVYYRLTGKVSDFKTGVNNGRNWLQFNLTDDTGIILVYGFEDGQYDLWASKIKDNGTVTLVGTYEFYSSKSQHEVMNTRIESFSEGAPPQVLTVTVTEAIATANSTALIIEEATVVAKSTMGVVVTDGTSNVYVYFDAKANETVPDVAIGDKVKVEAIKDTYGGVPELKKPTVTKISSGSVTYPEPADITASAATYTSSVTEYIKLSGLLSISGTYYNLTIDGVDAASKMGSISGPVESLGVSAFDGTKVTVTGYFAGITGSGKYINLVAVAIEAADPDAKYCSVSATAIKAKFNDTSVSFEVFANAAWTAECDNELFTISPASGEAGATITISFTANEDFEDRVANIKITCPEADKQITVVVTQTADVIIVGGNAVTWTLGENAYDQTSSGSSKQSAVINGVEVSELLKLGTSSKAGKATLTIPAGSTKIGFYCLGWSGKTSKLKVTCGSATKTFDIRSNSGVVQNPPYTITTSEDEAYYEYEITDTAANQINLESEGRVILWSINAY